jgi:hypothetical protein
MSNVPFAWVGKTLGNPSPQVFPCGHVQLVKGVDATTVDFQTAWEYADKLKQALEEARAKCS